MSKLHVLIGINLVLGCACLAWPVIAYVNIFFLDAPASTMSAFMDRLRTWVVILTFLYPIAFLISLVGGTIAYGQGASVWMILLSSLPALLNPVPWQVPILVFPLLFR